ncbi:MAG: sigma 54-interacting transcriptional regulator [Spirochaetales bacterium]|nr:sigma 54-interacting transcriptional regulator [Spirochaetales bacterium]
MFTVEFILPYTNLGPVVARVYEEHPHRNEMDCRMSFIAHDKVKTSELKGDVIIARGLTASYLNNLLKGSFTVLEIPMTNDDILTAIEKCIHRYGKGKIALVVTGDVLYGIEERLSYSGYDVATYEVSFASDIPATVRKAFDDGADFIVGGNEVVNDAEEMGYNGVKIEAGRQSIRQVLDEAWDIHEYQIEKEATLSRLGAVIENIGEGIIACDKNKRVTLCNRFAQEILEKTMYNISGMAIGKVDPRFDQKPFEKLIEPEHGTLLTINGTDVAVSRIPVIVKGQFESGVIVLQKLSQIQRIEVESRLAAVETGMVASHVFKDIVGNSNVLSEAKQIAMNYAKVNANILLLGETGTGKELFAQSIHNASERRHKPFVAVNCAALPESLLESELFGYVGGAFTGASKGGKPGLFEMAHTGTIFLDEISEMSLQLQGRLLRVIEERKIMRLGHDKLIPIDVRIIAASNQNLEELVAQGKFRKDLFYRLDVLRLRIPPLRERLDDLPILMDSFISHYDKSNQMTKHMIDPSIFPILESMDWPGNVRQLRNLCERLSTVVYESVITEKDIERCVSRVSLSSETTERPEKERISDALAKFNGNRSRAAESLGIDRSTLYRKMRRYGLMS